MLIEDGRIRAILPSAEAGSVGDARMIDLKGGYLMPGLWDVHIHPVKLPRFRRVVLDFGDYGSVVTASIAAS